MSPLSPPSSIRFASWFFVIAILSSGGPAGVRGDDPKDLGIRMMKTPAGTAFGISTDKPEKPAPTLFIFATALADMNRPEYEIFTRTGRELAQEGWVFVVINPPCHGEDHREGEPGGLNGWAHRLKQGDDMMGDWLKGCHDVVDYVIAEGYADPEQLAATGTSRGGFCALHFAASEPRIQAVGGVAPVTDLLALTEFDGMDDHQPTLALHVMHLAEKLAGRKVLLTIGNDDMRVSTDECIKTARRYVEVTRDTMPDIKIKPVELIVGPSDGHSAIDNAYEIQSAWFRRVMPR